MRWGFGSLIRRLVTSCRRVLFSVFWLLRRRATRWGQATFRWRTNKGGEASQGLATEQSRAAIFEAIWILFLAKERCNQAERRQEPPHPWNLYLRSNLYWHHLGEKFHLFWVNTSELLIIVFEDRVGIFADVVEYLHYLLSRQCEYFANNLTGILHILASQGNRVLSYLAYGTIVYVKGSLLTKLLFLFWFHKRLFLVEVPKIVTLTSASFECFQGYCVFIKRRLFEEIIVI